MPRRPAVTPLADQDAAEGGIATLDRALSLLNAFTAAQPKLTLAELAERTQIYKSTVLRMLASLEHANLVHRQADGRYVLGAGVERLHQVFSASFSLESIVMPALTELVRATQESAAFYVRQGEQRLCLYRVHSPRPVRDHLQPGDLLPLDRGAGGRIILAYSGAKGAMYNKIRREHIVVRCLRRAGRRRDGDDARRAARPRLRGAAQPRRAQDHRAAGRALSRRRLRLGAG
jgi:hypothetical protein